MARGKVVPGGRGSIDPTFTPSVGTVQPTISQPVTETPLEQLSRVLLSAGGLGAQALQTAANAKRSRDALREQSVARNARLMAQVSQGQVTVQQSLQTRRLEDVQKMANDFVIRSEDHDPIWLMRQARTQMVNAGTVEEAEVWQALFTDAKELADAGKKDAAREREIEIVNQFALAGQTADIAIKALGDRLKLDPDLQNQMIGDGTGIHDRVQDWSLQEAQRAAPELFDIQPNDPDRKLKEEQRDGIVVQLIRSSLPIANRLIEQASADMEDASTETGIKLVTAQLTSFLKGGIGIEAMAEALTSAASLHFNHLSSTEIGEKAKDLVGTAMDAAIRGRFGFDISELEPRLTALIDVGPFTIFEQAELKGAVEEGLMQMAVTQYGALVTRERLTHTVVVPTPLSDGALGYQSVVRPDALQSMALPGPDGRTEFDRIATQAIIEAGLNKNDVKSPIELAAIARILDTAAEFNAKGQRANAAASAEFQNARQVFGGDPSGDPAAAYETALARRAFSDERMLESSQIQQILETEALIRGSRSELEGAATPDQVWDPAQPMQRTIETRSLREAVWSLEARGWSDDRVASNHPLPTNMIAEMNTLWTQGGPEEMHDVLMFGASLTEIRMEELLSGLGDGTTAALSLRNAIHTWKLGANNITFRPAIEDLMSTARTAQAVSPPSDFLSASTPFIDFAGSANRDVAAASFAEVLAVKRLSGFRKFANTNLPGSMFVEDASTEYSVNLSNIQANFSGPTKPIVDRMFELWAMRVQVTNDTPSEAANFVFEMMKADGYHFTNIDGEVTIVQDPQFHFGPDDPGGRELRFKIEQYLEQPLKPWQQDVMVRALGIENLPTRPETLADLYFFVPDLVNPSLIQDDRGVRSPIDITVSEGVNRDSQFTLRKSAFDFGGVILHGRDPTNPQRILPTIRAKHNVTYIGPDGQERTLAAGEPLMVFSFQLLESGVTTNTQVIDIPGITSGGIPITSMGSFR